MTADFAQAGYSYENNAELEKEAAVEMSGDRLYASATSLQTFACCPYKYFAMVFLG